MASTGTAHRLLDGTDVLMRAVRPTDAAGLVRFHEALSTESQRLRFFGFHPHLTAKEVARFTTLDHCDREAFVVVLGSEILGIGRYDRRGDPSEAEVAFATLDDHQGSGIATLLFHRLAAEALASGISTFVADTLAENRKMRQLFVSTGLVTRRSFHDGVVTLTMALPAG
jgi:GNAT superfamily N-acetyltransferase